MTRPYVMSPSVSWQWLTI